jgi:molecular chaperone GrpE
MGKKDKKTKSENDTIDKELAEGVTTEDIEKAISDAKADDGKGGNGPWEEARDIDREGGEAEGAVSEEAALDELEAARDEARENHEKYLRAVAELENFKKRMQREQVESTRYANEELVKSLLPVIDNLERALAHAGEDTGTAVLVEGIQMVLKQFIETLGKFGVEQVDAHSKPFDPNYHEAVVQMETDAVPPNMVVEVLSKGYILRDRLIRPAAVGVSKGFAKDEKSGAYTSGEGDAVFNEEGKADNDGSVSESEENK